MMRASAATSVAAAACLLASWLERQRSVVCAHLLEAAHLLPHVLHFDAVLAIVMRVGLHESATRTAKQQQISVAIQQWQSYGIGNISASSNSSNTVNVTALTAVLTVDTIFYECPNKFCNTTTAPYCSDSRSGVLCGQCAAGRFPGLRYAG